MLAQGCASGDWSLYPLFKAKENFLQLLSFHRRQWELNIQLEKCICTQAGLAGLQVDPDLLLDVFSYLVSHATIFSRYNYLPVTHSDVKP